MGALVTGSEVGSRTTDDFTSAQKTTLVCTNVALKVKADDGINLTNFFHPFLLTNKRLTLNFPEKIGCMNHMYIVHKRMSILCIQLQTELRFVLGVFSNYS